MLLINPHLSGICLPRNILDLFPEPSHSGTYVSHYIQEFETLESTNLSASSILTKNLFTHDAEVASGAPDESVVSSSMSDLSASNKRVRKKISTLDSTNVATETSAAAVSLASSGGTIAKHNRSECLVCCRSKIINKIVDTTSLNIQEQKDVASHNGKTRDPDVSFYSPESIVSDDSANTNMPDRITNTILRNVSKMANPIMFKACRKILMELKQKYPQSFQDICLYSEICKHMSRCSYRMTVRRFIQEIFLDLNYDAFTNGVDVVLDVAQQRFTDLKLLNTSRMLPLSPSLSSASENVPSPSIPSQIHKLHSLKSPLLASVYETSVENLMDSPSPITKDEVDAKVTLRSPEDKKASPGSSTQTKAEVHSHRHSMDTGADFLDPMRRRRFNTLELDLSCTRNKFPIKHRLESPSGPLATSTLRRPVSFNTGREGDKLLYKSNISTSDHNFEIMSRRTISSPISPPIGTLFCEQRLLTSSRSEATLTNKDSDKKSDDKK